MATSIFFSWQDDTSPQTGRRFLREAIDTARDAVAKDSSVDEALRDELVVESDTEGIAGQPPIVETILRKIDDAAVVIADITFTGSRVDGRPTPNPNVLIEYGWAMKSLGNTRVITVMNEEYGKATRDSLPFDLSHLRFPLRFSLPMDATPEQKKEIKNKLVGDLKLAIRTSLTTVPAPTTEPLALFPEAIPKDGPARFRTKGEELGYYEGFGGQPESKIYLNSGAAMWLRLMPSNSPGRTWSPHELREVAQRNNGLRLHPLAYGTGLDWLRAEDGWGVYNPPGKTDDKTALLSVNAIVFVFQTGEIWSVDTALLEFTSDRLPFIEPQFNAHFDEYRQFLDDLGMHRPYNWIAGITGVKGRRLNYPAPPGQQWFGRDGGPLCLSESIEDRGVIKEGQSAPEALRSFYRKIFEKCGRERPEYLD